MLEAILRAIGRGSQWFVEFGVGEGGEGNCVMLADRLGWAGLFIESDANAFARLRERYRERSQVRTLRASVTPDNVEQLFAQAGVPRDLDVLSIDIDGNDYWVWEAVEKFTPRVVVVEYNANLPLEARLVMTRDDSHRWDGTDYFGASLGALRSLGTAKGYELVHTDTTGVNAFFVRGPLCGALPTGERVPLHRANYGGVGVTFPASGRAFLNLDAHPSRSSAPRPQPGGS